MKNLLKKIFGNKGCRLSYCKSKPTKTLRATMGSEVIKLDYCQEHAELVDEMFKDKEIKFNVPYDYKELNK